jgi:hypothetical protein
MEQARELALRSAAWKAQGGILQVVGVGSLWLAERLLKVLHA